MLLTYKYALNPTKKQAFILGDLLFQMQQVYNDALNERWWNWERNRRSINFYDQAAHIKHYRKAFPEEMGLLNTSSIQRTLKRADSICQQFYKGNRGRPRFKGAKRFNSVTYTHRDGSRLDHDRLYIQHVGKIKVRLHRQIPDDAKIKTVTIKRKNKKWYATFVIDIPAPEKIKHHGEPVGIDVGIKSLLTLSNGEFVNNPRWFRNSLKKRRVLNRKFARQKQFSNGWKKTAFEIAKHEEHIANQRNDFWHKVTHELANKYSLIAVEKLNLSFMLKNRSLSLSAHDAALGKFFELISYKVEKTGSELVKVNPKNTSQVCSSCGVIVKKGLSVRIHNCNDCGLVLDRDHNAALNILSLGLSAKGLTWPVAASVPLEAPSL